HAARGSLARAAGFSGEEETQLDFRYRLRFPNAVVGFNEGNVDTDEVRSARELRAGTLSLDCFHEGLEGFADLARDRGFVPVLTYTPSAHTAYSQFVEFRDPTLADLLPWFSRSQRDFLRKESERLGVAFLDLTPTLQEAA